MAADTPYSHPVRTAALPQRKPHCFDLSPDAAARAAIAAELGLLDLPSVRLKGELRPSGRRDFVLDARLSAGVVQPCVVTLAPVPARIDEPVTRRYMADYQEPQGDDVEMPEDDTTEALGEVIDLGAVLVEALSLALPLYPRADGATFEGQIASEAGAEPLTDEKLRPFAGLADLLKGKDSPE
ncbi:DUF177 domain-containing protein [Frigidibacter sp. SD6-1]|uniref:YceD family protein n=1 Tax=Frigidibacter sp. SD6-1 TaxID=3032581 RepID=UPI0024DF3B7E|nr:DUF177 domain-containing protein [Frigidibacter sp. SD6-1]